MYCTNCGKELGDGFAFCPHCGAKQPLEPDGFDRTFATQGISDPGQKSFENGDRHVDYKSWGYDESGLKRSEIQTRSGARECAIVGLVLSAISMFLALWGILAVCGIVFSVIGLVRNTEGMGTTWALAVLGVSTGIASLLYTLAVMVGLA